MRAVFVLVVLILAVLIQKSLSHPTNVETSIRIRLLDPPGRASIGRFRPECNLTKNFDDDKLYCGDYLTQHNWINRGRCGICGDPWHGAHPHQAGGLFASGTLARSYKVGEAIEVAFSILEDSVNVGFLTFALCPHNDIHSSPDPECFNRHRLLVLDHHRAGGWKEYAWTEPRDQQEGRGDFKNKLEYFTLLLPPSLSCSHCILQYTYTGSQYFAAGPQSAHIATPYCLLDNEPKLGCGNQVTFRGCSDICIGDFCPRDPQCITAENITPV